MLQRTTLAVLAVGLTGFVAWAEPTTPPDVELDHLFRTTVRPFVEGFCLDCHSGPEPEAQFDLASYSNTAAVVRDYAHWSLVLDRLAAREMPPEDAPEQPTAEARQAVIDWISAVRTNEAVKNAGDPGVVLARRLSNAEYNYSVRDLTGVDIRPAREFPVDPANPAGFDNSGESLAMSPALLGKYLQAAREVANHMVLKPRGLAFAPHPMLVETDRDKYCIQQIMDFYGRQATDYSQYFHAAWQYQHRVDLGKPDATLNEIAAENGVSPKYLATVWSTLVDAEDELGPIAKLRAMWRELPAPAGDDPELARASCDAMRDYVVAVRKKLEVRFTNLEAGRGIGSNSQPMLMWKNRQYATHRRAYDPAALQMAGEAQPARNRRSRREPGADNEFGPGATRPVNNAPGDPDLAIPAGDREPYEAAYARFASVFPDAFYVSERGRNYLDKTKDRGRFLSAGFHNLMGYFRDDLPLCELVLDEVQQQDLDAMWQELDFVASGMHRTFVQFFLNEAREAREFALRSLGDDAPAEDKAITSERMIHLVAENFLERARRGGNQVAIQAVEDHFQFVNATIRWVEQARIEAEPIHLQAMQDFAARAYHRPLTSAERDDLDAYYRSLRDEGGLDHEEAMRDLLVSVLMSPDFCYRIDLVDSGQGIHPLSDYALASRLSYFLWSSLPDEELLARAEAGDLRQPEVLAAQARRMLKDDRIRGLAHEFGGNWLDFRRFEEHNAVDRERFSTFDNELRQAMFEEPIQFMLDVFREDRSVLQFLYADHTFVNAPLARHYGMPPLDGPADQWIRVDKASRYERGGLLPMAVFLTKNAPGLRTSPVKRGYWVVKNVLGEHIPPPPAAVPELPSDEAELGELTLRETLAKHREDPSCAACHQRFDSLGLVFEGFGPVGERRDKDLGGRPIESGATFPDGSERQGVAGLRDYVRDQREGDFLDNLCRKLLAYALGRSLMLSDEVTVADLRVQLSAEDHRFGALVEAIVTSPQFRTKRGSEKLAQQGD